MKQKLWLGSIVDFLFSQEKNNDREEILFVGNSFTFFWNLPSIVEKMANERSLNWHLVTLSTACGSNS